MKVCGLTGGVGMGKSTSADFLKMRGAKVVDADELARQLVQPGKPALAAITKLFGNKIISAAGQLRRDQLAKIVFSDSVARQKLEAILHPPIREAWLAQIEAWRGENCPLAIVVIPLLFETRAESHFGKIICAACSPKSQDERLRARGWHSEQIAQRIAAQMPVEQKIARSNFVIWTEGNLSSPVAQVERILEKL